MADRNLCASGPPGEREDPFGDDGCSPPDGRVAPLAARHTSAPPAKFPAYPASQEKARRSSHSQEVHDGQRRHLRRGARRLYPPQAGKHALVGGVPGPLRRRRGSRTPAECPVDGRPRVRPASPAGRPGGAVRDEKARMPGWMSSRACAFWGARLALPTGQAVKCPPGIEVAPEPPPRACSGADALNRSRRTPLRRRFAPGP